MYCDLPKMLTAFRSDGALPWGDHQETLLTALSGFPAPPPNELDRMVIPTMTGVFDQQRHGHRLDGVVPSNSQTGSRPAKQGESATPTSDFIAAVEDFDHRFIAAMAVRIQSAADGGIGPSIRVDIDHVIAEHSKRAEHFAQCRTRTLSTDWAAIRQGAREIQLPQ